jgi:hypothetical protein
LIYTLKRDYSISISIEIVTKKSRKKLNLKIVIITIDELNAIYIEGDIIFKNNNKDATTKKLRLSITKNLLNRST